MDLDMNEEELDREVEKLMKEDGFSNLDLSQNTELEKKDIKQDNKKEDNKKEDNKKLLDNNSLNKSVKLNSISSDKDKDTDKDKAKDNAKKSIFDDDFDIDDMDIEIDA